MVQMQKGIPKDAFSLCPGVGAPGNTTTRLDWQAIRRQHARYGVQRRTS